MAEATSKLARIGQSLQLATLADGVDAPAEYLYELKYDGYRGRVQRIKSAKDANDWSAHANVLSEIVEHHLEEEERDLLPRIRKAASPDVDAAMLRKFLALRAKSQSKVTHKNAGVLAEPKG